MSSVSVLVASTINATETFTGDSIGSNNSVNHTALDQSATLTAGSSPPATLYAGGTVALVAGAKTLDLTALAEGTNGGVIDGSSLKVQAVRFTNKAASANSMTFTEGASNGYALAGASWTFDLAPGQYCMFSLNDASPDVAGADAEIDVTGTLVQEFEYELIFG